MKLAFPFVLMITIFAFIAGASVNNLFFAPFKSSNEQNKQPVPSSATTQDQANTPGLSGEAAPVATHNLNGQTYTTQSTGDKVVISGDYNVSSYKLNYVFNLPKNGGDITGSISGSCEGTLTGKAEKPNQSGEAAIKGQYSADCKVILGFKTKASGTFDGTVKYREGKAQINISNNEPVKQSGGFELLFIP